MNPFAAGIVLYTLTPNGVSFLLGKETSNKKWSGFVGGSEDYETPIETALREFNEETALTFIDYYAYFLNALKTHPPTVNTTSTGKTVYIWFVEWNVDENVNSNLLNQFVINKKSIGDKHFKEKSQLKWFTLSQIRAGNVLYRLKNTIHEYFK